MLCFTLFCCVLNLHLHTSQFEVTTFQLSTALERMAHGYPVDSTALNYKDTQRLSHSVLRFLPPSLPSSLPFLFPFPSVSLPFFSPSPSVSLHAVCQETIVSNVGLNPKS